MFCEICKRKATTNYYEFENGRELHICSTCFLKLLASGVIEPIMIGDGGWGYILKKALILTTQNDIKVICGE